MINLYRNLFLKNVLETQKRSERHFVIHMARNNHKALIAVLAVVFIFAVFIMYQYGLFHGIQSWPEYKFIGKNIEELKEHLQTEGLHLSNVTFDIAEIATFENSSQKAFSPMQRLYKFWGGKEHQFWWFPIGTKIYGLYVLVENGEIICFQETSDVDSL